MHRLSDTRIFKGFTEAHAYQILCVFTLIGMLFLSSKTYEYGRQAGRLEMARWLELVAKETSEKTSSCDTLVQWSFGDTVVYDITNKKCYGCE